MRMNHAHKSGSARKPVNLTVDAELLARARQHGLNLSATLERALVAELGARERASWLAVHEPAVAAYNAGVERDGVFSDGTRSF